MKALSFTGTADILAGKAADEDIDGFRIDRAHIFVAGYIWPVFLQDGSTEGIDLTLPADRKPGPFKAEVQTANS